MENADRLFRKHPVSELRLMESKIRMDIDRKKQDLRLMVGERYRDLIDAADSIREMKKSSHEVERKFHQLQDLCDIKSLRRFVQTKMEKHKDEALEIKKQRIYPVAAQIKLLVDTPEQIWHSLENHNYLRASRLYLIARLVHRNLQSSKEAQAMKIAISFPVVQRQWDAVSHFKTQIVQRALQHLHLINQSDQSLTETMLAIMLLDNVPSKEMLEKFLSVRKACILDTLSSFDKSTFSASDHFYQYIDAFYTTIHQIMAIFVCSDSIAKRTSPLTVEETSRTSPSVFDVYLENLQKRTLIAGYSVNQNAEGSNIHLAPGLYSEKTNVHLILRHLPPTIQNFTPILNSEILGENSSLSKAMILDICRSWSADLLQVSQKHIGDVLRHVSSGQNLFNIRQEILASIQEIEGESPHGSQPARGKSKRTYPPMTQLYLHGLLNEGFSLWKDLFNSPINIRALEILSTMFQALAMQSETLVKPLLSKLEVHERNVSQYMWANDLNADSFISEPSFIQCKTYTSFQKLVAFEFEKKLLELHGDFASLMIYREDHHSSIDQSASPVKAFSRRPSEASMNFHDDIGMFKDDLHLSLKKDAEKLRKAFEDGALEALLKYRTKLLELLQDIKADLDKHDNTPETQNLLDKCVFLGRCAKAIAVKLRSLGKILLMSEMFSEETASATSQRFKTRRLILRSSERNADSQTSEREKIIGEVYAFSLDIWAQVIVKKHMKEFREQLKSENLSACVEILHEWDEIKLSAENTENTQSSYYLPTKTSSCLFDRILQLAHEMHRISAYGLENTFLGGFILQMAVGFFQEYDHLVENNSLFSEKGAIQVLFDLKYLMKFFEGAFSIEDLHSSGLSAKSAQEKATATINAVRLKIDPIDLAVVESALAMNVEKYYCKGATLFASFLILNPKAVESRKKGQELTGPALSQTISPRFPLLPVTNLPRKSVIGSSTGRTSATESPAIRRLSMTFQSTSLDMSSPSRDGALIEKRPTRSKPRSNFKLIKAVDKEKIGKSNALLGGIGAIGAGVLGLVSSSSTISTSSASTYTQGSSQGGIFNAASSLLGYFSSNTNAASPSLPRK